MRFAPSSLQFFREFNQNSPKGCFTNMVVQHESNHNWEIWFCLFLADSSGKGGELAAGLMAHVMAGFKC